MSLDPELAWRLDRIRPTLALLSAFDPAHEVFGADTHHYALAPPLSEDDLARFERSRGIALPREYRAFLARVGGSGAGPYAGLSPLDPEPDASPPDAPDDDEAGPLERPRPPDPTRPFLLRGAYPPNPRLPTPLHEGPLPAGAHPRDGCLHLAEQGCCYASYLVLNGTHAGEVWDDFTAAEGSLMPVGLGFLTWYERWLSDAAHEAADNAALEAVLEGETAVDGRVVEQIPRFDEACARHPTWAHGHARRGFVLLHARRLVDAEAAFVTALEVDARCTHALLGLAANKAAHGNYRGALAMIDALLAEKGHSYSTRTHALTLRASVLRTAGRARGARAAEEALLTHAGRRPFYHLEQAFRLARAGDVEGAEATVRAAERRFGDEGLGGLDEWLHRLAAPCAVKGRADLAALFEARAAAARALSRARDADRRSWPEGPIDRHFFP